MQSDTQAIPIEIYQLRIWIKGISPMIWRRILVRSDTSIADLHHCIQIIMGWDGDHLHQFIIHGKAYGIGYIGGVSFSNNPRKVYLRDFQLYINEKFLYEYNFYDSWKHEIRLEQKLPFDPRKTYPMCIDGKHSIPPDDCGGPQAFMELCEQNSPWHVENQILELMENYKAGDIDKDTVIETLKELTYWVDDYHNFKLDKKEINDELQEHFQHENDNAKLKEVI